MQTSPEQTEGDDLTSSPSEDEEATGQFTDADDQGTPRTADSAESAMEALMKENAELKDRLLRAVAETENVRRRAEKEKVDAAKFGISRFARDLMSVADNFARALGSIHDDMGDEIPESVTNLITGIEMTEKELLSAFERNGVVQVRPARGEKFDPNLHQAVAEIPVEGQPGGTIFEVTQTGYALDDRLLRPAMVVVARNAGPGSNGDAGQDPGSNVNTTV